jgi:hypothetical protein
VMLWSLVAFKNFSEESAVYIKVEDGWGRFLQIISNEIPD